MDRPELAAYQIALVDALAAGAPPHAVIERLRDDPRAAALGAYVASFDARAVECLTKLMARWGARAPERPPPSSAKRRSR